MDPKLKKLLKLENKRQDSYHHFIASENFVSQEVKDLTGSNLTNKYAEGYPGKRYYNGCDYYDKIEEHANELLNYLYGCKYSNVQPHSGANANLAVFKAFLKPGDKILGMDLSAGGHLSHGSKANVSGKWFDSFFYGVTDQGLLDYDNIENLVKTIKPKLLIAGASAYPRIIDWKKLKEIAVEYDALFLADMAHYSGLIAGDAYPNPLPYADIVTSTTHKTLRGARGGMILWNDEKFTKKINSAIFPGTQGGPLMNHVAGKAQAFFEASQPEFKGYAQNVVEMAKIMCDVFKKREIKVITGGTDSHIVLVETGNKSGKEVANTLEDVHNIIVNKNSIPNDPRGVWDTSGIRIGTAAMTTIKGPSVKYFTHVANQIADVIKGK